MLYPLELRALVVSTLYPTNSRANYNLPEAETQDAIDIGK